jgi:hypothetical protein
MPSCGAHPVCLACERLDHQLTTCANAVWSVSSAFSSIVPCSSATEAAGGEVGSDPESLTRMSQLARMFSEEEQARLGHLLNGAQFEVSKGRLSQSVWKLHKQVRKVTKTAAKAAETVIGPAAAAVDRATAAATEQARQSLERLIPDMFDESLPTLQANFPEIFADVIPAALEAVAAAAAQAAPLVGAGMNATKMVASAYSSLTESKSAIAARLHAAHFAVGPPREAANAVQRIRARKANGAAIKSAIGAVALAGHAPADAATIASLAGTPFSFGGSAAFVIPTAAVGAFTSFAKALVSFLYALHLIARDYRETKRANRLMASGEPLDERIFEVCPMLGAAYLVETEEARRQQLVRLPRTFVDSVCAGGPEASVTLAAAAAAAKRILRIKPKSFTEQVSDDLTHHIDPTIAAAQKELRRYGWVLNGPNVRVANTLTAETQSPYALVPAATPAKAAALP